MFSALIDSCGNLLQRLNAVLQDVRPALAYLSSRRFLTLSLLIGWILLNTLRESITNYWYDLNFKEPWNATDYPPLCSDNSRLLPWMSGLYPALSNPDSNIRLLHLQPAHDWQEITATLQSVSFLERPKYRALSYTWGDTTCRKPIVLNGKRMDISENLWRALFNIRDSERVQTLWVDALCINQNNIEEKNVQIPLLPFIYSRAVEVIVWLGDYRPPRWVEQGEVSQWHGNWALQKANDYWSVTKYWLYVLTQQEYWKRCWVVQEIVMASKVRVYSGRHSIPWHDFTELMKLYKSKVPTDRGAIDNILKLENIRQAKYIYGDPLTLAGLLDQFSDCFCSVTLDKIFAFLGLANDCVDGCMTVDYSLSARAAYRDLICSRETRALRTGDEAIELIHFSALTRSILTRQPLQAPLILARPWPNEDTSSLVYRICGDDRSENCKLIPSLHSVLSWIDLANGVAERAISYFLRRRTSTKSLWLPPSPEPLATWTSRGADDLDVHQNQVRIAGSVAGVICVTGPTYREFIENPSVPTKWASSLGQLCGLTCNMTTMRSARAIYNRLSLLLGSSADYRLRNIVSNEDGTPYSFYSSRLFVAFGPHQDVMMGLAPWQALPGDVLVEFWNSSAVLVARRPSDGSKFSHIGRAGLVKEGGSLDWHVASDRTLFDRRSDLFFATTVSIDELTSLSLDTVQLVGTSSLSGLKTDQQPKDLWTSHDFEMGDVELFTQERDYENDWLAGLSEVQKLPLLDVGALTRSCHMNPCQMDTTNACCLRN